MKKAYYLGIDLGGTNTKMGLVSDSGKLIKSTSIPTLEGEGPAFWQERIALKVKEWNLGVKAVGVASPGPLDVRTGTILKTPNLRTFQGYSMRQGFRKHFKVKSFFENDANCAALAEFYFGKNKKLKDFVVLTLGTGVGSGVISGGQLIRGHLGFASELGHMVIDMKGPPCFCGNRGCLEAYVGARNMMVRYTERGGKIATNVKEIFENIENDPLASALFDEWALALSVGLANVINIFNPSKIIMSGGVTGSWKVASPVVHKLISSMIQKDILQSTKIETTGLGSYFGVLGAAARLIEG